MTRDRSLIWPAVALVAVLAGFVLVGLLLMPEPTRPELVRGAGSTLAPAIGTILAAVAAAVAAFTARASHKETQAQTPMIAAAQKSAANAEVQTNGQLTARLNKAIGEALDARGLTIDPPAPAPVSGPDVEVYDPADATAPASSPPVMDGPVVMPVVGAG